MTSAAERVFAITEILEQILIDCDLNTRELFRWQTVSRNFHHAINGSTPLLRIMEILHQSPEERRYRVLTPILWLEQLELWTSYRPEVLSPASPRNNTTGWKVNLHVSLDIDPDNPAAEVGVKSSKFFVNPLDGSWRRMKISRFPVLIEVPLRVSYKDISYEEITSDGTGEMTIGELADLVENARRRSEEQHRERAAQILFDRLQVGEEDEDGPHEEVAGCCVS